MELAGETRAGRRGRFTGRARAAGGEPATGGAVAGATLFGVLDAEQRIRADRRAK